MDAEIIQLRKSDAEEKHRLEVEFLEKMAELVRERKLSGYVFVGIEHTDDDVEIECTTHRRWVFTGAIALLALIGAAKVVLDEVSEYFRGFVVQ